MFAELEPEIAINNNASHWSDHVGPLALKSIVVGMFSALMIGFAANLWVAATVIKVLRILWVHLPEKHMLIYVLALSLVDLAVLANVPWIICDMAAERWALGEFLCKFHWAADGINKVSSVMVLTALSFDRYLTVCHPYFWPGFKSVKATVFVVFTCFLGSAALLTPFYVNAGLVSVRRF